MASYNSSSWEEGRGSLSESWLTKLGNRQAPCSAGTLPGEHKLENEGRKIDVGLLTGVHTHAAAHMQKCLHELMPSIF